MSSEDSGVWGEQQLYSSDPFKQKGSHLERSHSLVDEMLLGLINSDEGNEQCRSKRILSDAHQSLAPTKVCLGLIAFRKNKCQTFIVFAHEKVLQTELCSRGKRVFE